ncbi:MULTISPECIES: type II toxin-antitoxin system HicB family antitoxin [Clostridia]|uniref:Pilus assembly protein HicB n=1 Tax=Lacrimispora celerecrescens TaxID=29354 RepID=A0A084JJ85_9FIRM|nr:MULTISPECIES: type II toxin-antitoxin system HicB family antitoxin [Clostridia]KEZ89019.1 pilus assembly protein HicB [Lacrimispora celerecrescens]MSS08556.1 HicB family protein [Clostridium sp. WB02_MRS01]
MLSAYPACFFKEENGYSVIFPGLNHLATCGETLDEALAMAIDCLAGYLYLLRKDGEIAPDPLPMNEVNLSDIAKELEIESTESFINMVTVDVAEYARTHFERSVKKTLTIPAWLNAAAIERHINFSQVLQEALMQKMQIK